MCRKLQSTRCLEIFGVICFQIFVLFLCLNSLKKVVSTDSNKNHLRRNVETKFGDSLHLFTLARRVYARKDHLSLEVDAIDYVVLKIKTVNSHGLQKPKRLRSTYISLLNCL